MNNHILITTLQESLLLFFLIGSLFALLLGLLFIASPARAKQFSQSNNRWLSLRRSTKPLEIPRSIEQSFYRHHRLIGLFILLSAAYILYRFGFDFQREHVVRALVNTGINHSVVVGWLLDALLWFLIPVSLLLLLFGATMALKPSNLKGLERHLNRWISTRKILQPIEKSNYYVDNWIISHPRHFGLTLCIAALYNLTLFFLFYFNK